MAKALCFAGLLLHLGSAPMAAAEEPGMYNGGLFYRTSYIRSILGSNAEEVSAFNLQFFNAATRAGSRGFFVLDDFDSYVAGYEVNVTTMLPLETALTRKLSDGNPMTGAFLNGDATDATNLIYTDTIMNTPAIVDPTGFNVTFKLRSQMTRKLNSYDWDIANYTGRFYDAPLVLGAEYDPSDKDMLTVTLTLKRPLVRSSTTEYGIKYKNTNTGFFFYFPPAPPADTQRTPANTGVVTKQEPELSSGTRLFSGLGILLSMLVLLLQI